jgi:carboxyl-terminal processing protease
LVRKFIVASLSVLAALTLAGLAFFAQQTHSAANQAFNASLGGGSGLGDEPAAVEPAVESEEGAYDLAEHQVLSGVIVRIRENYVDPERVKPYEMFLAALDYVQKSIPEVMVDESMAPRKIKVLVDSHEQVFDLERLGGLDKLYEVNLALRDIFQFLKTYIHGTDRLRDIEYAAVNGMLSTLDPHSILLKPESFNDVKTSTKGEFGGLGIVISIRDGALTVVAPIEGTPASRAGLKAKDQIVRIGEEATINMALDEAVNRLRGKPGTKVTVWVQRRGWTEPRRFVLTRAIIKIESVSSELLDGGVGYVRIKSFQANTFDDLQASLDNLRQKNKADIKGLVLDLRNNPGGLLEQAIAVADKFIDRGPIVITVGEGNKKREVRNAKFDGTDRSYPIAVLVNGGSASASEIVAGALKNHDRAAVIGQLTFGKGSVQVLYDFPDKSALKLTVAQYLTPGDISIQSVGITPDVAVVPAVIAKEQLHMFVDDDSPHEKDLEHHLDIPDVVAGPSAQKNAPPGAVAARASQGQDAERTTGIVTLIDKPEEPPENEPSESTPPETFKMDFEIRLARDLLSGAHGTLRPEILAQNEELFRQRFVEEEKRIVDRLRELGVDWRDGLQNGNTTGTVHATVDLRPKAMRLPIAAGTTVTLVATAHNDGTTPLYRLYGVTNSDNPFFKNLEFAFGYLPPGQSRSWEVPIKIPAEMPARADSITLTLGDRYGVTRNVSTSLMLTTEAQPEPRFASEVWVDDRAHGNGDGALQVGEEVDVRVEIQNVGLGAAKDAVVTLKNLSDETLFLDRGREKLGALPAGAVKVATLGFTVKKAADKAQVRVSVWDAVLGEAVAQTLTLPILPNQKVKHESHTLHVTTDHTPVYAGAWDTTEILGFAKAGTNLQSDASFGGGYYRVPLPRDREGFVRLSAVEVGAAGRVKKGPVAGLSLLAPQAPPEMKLTLPALVTHNETYHITGTLSNDRALRDFYVYVNDRKVVYHSLSSVQPSDGHLSAPVNVTLSLKSGFNSITLIARENDDVVTRRFVGVYREQATAVAEHQNITH